MVAQDGNAPSNHRYERCGLLLAYRAILGSDPWIRTRTFSSYGKLEMFAVRILVRITFFKHATVTPGH